MPNEAYLYDDFFSPADAPGIPTTIEVRGKPLVIGLRLLSFGDMKRLLNNNAKVSIGPDGTPQVEMKDQQAGDTEMLLAALKSWPFKNADGSMVPINEQTLEEIHPDVLMVILKKVTEFVNATAKTQQEGINGPFVKP